MGFSVFCAVAESAHPDPKVTGRERETELLAWASFETSKPILSDTPLPARSHLLLQGHTS